MRSSFDALRGRRGRRRRRRAHALGRRQTRAKLGNGQGGARWRVGLGEGDLEAALEVLLGLLVHGLQCLDTDATVFQLSSSGPGSFVALNWKALVLLCTGFLGGIFSSIAGSGIDICSFACLTLLFRISEKTATPTSVVLMAINTVVGVLYREFAQGGVEPDAWGFLLVCAPIVCIGAPLGSVLGSFVHRLVLAWAVYITDTVQLVGAIVIVRPWIKQNKPGLEQPAHLAGTSAAIFFSGLLKVIILFRIDGF